MQNNIYAIKIYYADIKNSPLLTSILPLTVISRAKSVDHIYYSELDRQMQYKIAYGLFKEIGIITPNSENELVIDYSKLPFTGKTGTDLVENVSHSDMISYFIEYNIKIKNLLTTVYKKENVTAISIPDVFMDSLPDDLFALETSVKEFIVTVYRRFLSTSSGSIPFIPWFGTRIKQYLYELSVYQVAEMIQGELDGITNALKIYFIEKDIADFDFTAHVDIKENNLFDEVQYRILVTVDNAKYSITVK